MYVWVEWICKRCGELHRLRFTLKLSIQAKAQVTKELWTKGDVSIYDAAIRKKKKYNRVFADYGTPIRIIVEAVKEYMSTYYSFKENTFKVDICNE